MGLRKRKESGGARHDRAGAGGSTVKELIVTMAVITLLAWVHLPALGYHKATGRGFGCLNNLRQLTLGWLMYAEDNQGRLVQNLDGGAAATGTNSWVRGWLDYTGNRENTNTLNLVDARYTPLGPYTKRPEYYRCPEDPTTVRIGGQFHSRVRSYSMSNALGRPQPDAFLPSPPYRSFVRLADIVRPTPAGCWVLMEEHPDSINDGYFAVQMVEPQNLIRTALVDFPGYYHQGAVGISFADGHMELHRWVDARTKLPYGRPILVGPSPNNLDVLWLAQRTSSRAQ
ncbi:MAG: hypothetical protein HYY24_07785 [Verrucomicrobia bacterium]|nr:hypothetical protein [Verrucomicrobiota bacterium]